MSPSDFRAHPLWRLSAQQVLLLLFTMTPGVTGVPVPYHLDYCSFATWSEVRECDSSSCALLSQGCFDYLTKIFPSLKS